MQQMTMAASQQIVPGQVPTAVATPTAYLTGIPGASTQVGNTYTPYFSAAGPLIGPTTIITSDPNNPLAMAVQQTMVTQQKMPRNDRLDMDMKAVGTFYYENFAFPGMMQYKRAAGDKSGMPVFQQNTGAYQQLLQPFVPTVSFAAPPGIPRY
jgi:muscleblind protein